MPPFAPNVTRLTFGTGSTVWGHAPGSAIPGRDPIRHDPFGPTGGGFGPARGGFDPSARERQAREQREREELRRQLDQRREESQRREQQRQAEERQRQEQRHQEEERQRQRQLQLQLARQRDELRRQQERQRFQEQLRREENQRREWQRQLDRQRDERLRQEFQRRIEESRQRQRQMEELEKQRRAQLQNVEELETVSQKQEHRNTQTQITQTSIGVAQLVKVHFVTNKKTDPKLRLENGAYVTPSAPFRPSGDPIDVIIAAAIKPEGGAYDTVNLYDRGILSWGIYQWSLHAGSLQKMLAFAVAELKRTNQTFLWSQFFPGLDVRRQKGEYQIFHRSAGKTQWNPIVGSPGLRLLFRGSTQLGQFKKPVILQWAKSFALAGRNLTFQHIQNEYARQELNEIINLKIPISKVGPKHPSKYLHVKDYLGGDYRAQALFFGMWIQNPKNSFNLLKLTIDSLAKKYGTYDVNRWASDWEAAFSRRLEKTFRESKFHNWGDKVAKAAKRESRTHKILNEYDNQILNHSSATKKLSDFFHNLTKGILAL